MSNTHDIYIEAGEKKVIAVSLFWPGWTRMGKDEDEVLQIMLDYAHRYAVIPQKAKLDFMPPGKVSDFNILSREPGNKTTDYGVPITFLPEDAEKVDEGELARMQSIMRACWAYFDEVVAAAEGKQLQKGPRGGGRDLDKIFSHVVDAEEAYLKTLGAPWKTIENEPVEEKKQRLRQAAFEGMRMKLEGLLPEEGPRGGKRWPVPYYVRRLAWHVIDHTWEIEDRVIS
jgi:hypothetical protein